MKKNTVIYISIIASALVVGIAGGVVAKQILGKENVVYVGDSDSLYANGPEIKAKYESYKGSSQTKDFQTWELVVVSLEKYRNLEYSYSYSKGMAKTIVNQEIRNFQIRNGNNYFEESLSKSSMVSVAKRMYQTNVGGNVKVHEGTIANSNPESASFKEGYKEYNPQEYKNYLGRTLDTMFIYAISDKTVINQKTTVLDNGDIELYVDLSPTKSTVAYQVQMKNISNLDQRPVFDYVHLTYVVTSDMMLKTLHVDERFSAKSMGFEPTIYNDIDTYYYPNQKYEIPTYDTKVNYSLKGEQE